MKLFNQEKNVVIIVVTDGEENSSIEVRDIDIVTARNSNIFTQIPNCRHAINVLNWE